MDIPEDFEDVKPDLMPTVRTRSMIEVLRLSGQQAAMPVRRFRGDLFGRSRRPRAAGLGAIGDLRFARRENVPP
jgi:hypothetical protein